jgi:two-component system, LytTR family, sensor kinase
MLDRIKDILKNFIAFGGILTLLAFMTGFIKSQDIIKTFIVNGFASSLLGVGNGILADYLNIKFPWTVNTKLRAIVTVLTTVAFTFLAYLLIVYVWILVNDSSYSFMNVFGHNGLNGFLITLTITLFISTIFHGNGFLQSWKASVIEAEKLKKDHISAQYETLKNQVNPHFLFNSFNVLTTLVHKDADLAEKFVRQLSNVYRYVLESRDKEVVPFELEMKQLEAYIFLMKIRFGESLNVSINFLNINDTMSIAPLTLQMLLENALKHNAVSKTTPLKIEIYQDDIDYVVVKNQILYKNSVGESTGVGLENIRSRYKFLCDKNVVVSKEDDCFIVKIPIIFQPKL